MSENKIARQEGAPTWLDLYDYRRRVAALYRERERALVSGEDEEVVLEKFRAGRDALFARHPQSALNAEQRKGFRGLNYFPFNAELRVDGWMKPVLPGERVIGAADGEHVLTLRPAAEVEFMIEGSLMRLTVYWIDVYGGGLFLPFRDATCPEESYGGGRYLFDTVKGSDFLAVGDKGELVGIGGTETQGWGGGKSKQAAGRAIHICRVGPGEERPHRRAWYRGAPRSFTR